jgi:hypothetical protein
MLLRRAVLERIMAGEISCVFRIWRRPTVKSGGTLKTTLGVLSIGGVHRTGRNELGEADARTAEYGSLAELLDEIPELPDGDLYRITVSPAGPDPRISLRDTPIATAADYREIATRLERLDRARRAGAWTTRTMRQIADNPERPARDLAERAGRDTARFKADVRKLKALGLTESQAVGYRLSTRGRSFLRWHDADGSPDQES